jgi:DNA polymerase
MADSLKQIESDILQCQRCDLRTTATLPVPGHGCVGAKYLLIGEAPGRQEDEAGVPFVGLAGKRLDKLLALAGIDLNDCYLSNVCRCRPPENRTPRKKEIKACQEFLWREIELVKPETIITLGATPLGLFAKSGGVSQLHGTVLEVDGQRILPQYHPAAALHSPRLWATMLDDWENLPEVVPHDFQIVEWEELEARLA